MIDEIKAKVEGWVIDPGTMMGRVLADKRLMLSYWVMKNLMSHVLMDYENKE